MTPRQSLGQSGQSSIQLGSQRVDSDSTPYVIAEIGVNHEGSIELAKRLVELAKEGGADAAKFQTYKAETLASRHSPAYWDTTKEATLSQYELFKKYDAFGAPEYEVLAEHCKKVGIEFISTPFDDGAVDMLDSLVPFFKIASADITNTPLLRRVARTGKPVVLSVGAATIPEIDEALSTLRSAGANSIALLHCILNYPTSDEHANLRMIGDLAARYPECVIGYSDHTTPKPGLPSLLAAWLLGAVILEKHFTHDTSLPGNDHYHAMTVDDVRSFRSEVSRIAPLLGDRSKHPLESEEIARKNARRSIVVSRDLPVGHRISESDITYKRPGTGISPLSWDDVIGRKTRRELAVDDVLQWADLSEA
ncbi:MAG: N-acetylneuraminate synthase family protein [Ilumatobacteraceae bacterium]